MADFTILVGANSTGPVSSLGGDGTGFYDGGTNGGFSCSSSTPSPPFASEGAQASCVGWADISGGRFCVVLYGTLPQNYFTNVTLGAPANLTFASASALIYDASTYPGLTVWAWADSHTFTYLGDNLDVTFSGSAGVTVPDVTGETQDNATADILAATLTVGTVSSAYNSSVAAGLVFLQNPVGGTIVASGSTVDITLSLGPQVVAVPDILGLSAAAADAAIEGAGLSVGSISGVLDPSTPVGDVSTQSPVAGTLVSVGSAVDYGVSFIVPQFDVDATVISQYANSPTLLQLVEDFGQYFDPSANLQSFYLTVWNIDTAVGFGLDIWGIILGVSRVVTIVGASGRFGFENSDSPPDWENFGNLNEPGVGGPFYSGQIVGNSYKLDDDPYRVLLLTKALANICATTAQSLNALISNLFPGRGVCYTVDLGGMQMSYVFLFPLSVVEFAILADSGVLAHPAGVGINIVVIESGYFGFNEQGASVEPFNYGTFFN